MAALALVGGVISAVGAIRQGQAQQAMYDYQANLAKQNAAIAEAQGEASDQALARDQQRRMGQAVAAYGASGVTSDSGSPADVLADSARLATLDRLTNKYNYKLRSLGLQAQANIDTAAGENARTASYFSAMSSMANAGAQAYRMS